MARHFAIIQNEIANSPSRRRACDRITGAIVKKDGESLTVKSKNFGTVTLKWADVATVKSDQPLNVTLAGAMNTLPFVGESSAHVGGVLNTLVAPGVMPLANQFVGSFP